jgi:hypothetical protein
MKKKPLSIIIISIVGIFLIVGVFAVLGTTKSQYSPSSYDSRSSMDSIGDMGSYEGYYKGDVSISENEMVNNQEGSKVQKNGSVSVLVENIDESIEALKSINNTFGGQITNIYDNGKGKKELYKLL